MSKQEAKAKKEVAPWRPFSDIARWERLMDDVLGRRFRPLWVDQWLSGKDLGIPVPALDLYEEKDEIVAKAEIPGIEKDAVQVNITDHLLTIKGEKKKEEETKEKNFYRAERSYGAFSRSVELPADVQVEKARASFRNGVLEIHLPKTDEAKKKEVKVNVE
jgi:HSP20 family protein